MEAAGYWQLATGNWQLIEAFLAGSQLLAARSQSLNKLLCNLDYLSIFKR